MPLSEVKRCASLLVFTLPLTTWEARLVSFELRTQNIPTSARVAWQQKEQKALSSLKPRRQASLGAACSG